MTQSYPSFPSSYPGQPQDGPPIPPGAPLRPRRRIRPVGMVLRLVFGALAGAAVTLMIHGWGAVITESGGSCGGRYGGSCPHGTLVGAGLAMAVSFFVVPITIATLLRRPRWLSPLVALAVVAGVFAGQALWGQLHGATVSTVWSAPPDTNPELSTVAGWVDGNTVVRARVDQVIGYDAGTGRVDWTYRVPGQDVLCSASQGVDDRVDMHVVAVAVATGSTDPCSRIVGLDVRTGKQLWQVTSPAEDEVPNGPTTDYLAVGDAVLTVGSGNTVTGYNDETGQQLWTQPAPPGCRDAAVAADHGGLAVLWGCDNSAVVESVDPAIGKPKWQARRDAPDGTRSESLVNAEPVVVDERLTGPRHDENLVSYGAAGDPATVIPVSSVSTPDGPAPLRTDPYAFTGAPRRELWVLGGEIIGLTQSSGTGPSYVVGLSLVGGQELWHTELPADPLAAAFDGSHVLVLADDDPSSTLVAVPAGGAAPATVGVVPHELSQDTLLYPLPNGSVAAIAHDAEAPESPVQVLKP